MSMYMHMLVYILLYASIFFQTFKLQKLSLNVTTPYMQNGVIFVESETWKWDLLNHFWKKIMKIFYFLPVLWGSLISLNMIVKCYHDDVLMYLCLRNAQLSCLCLVSVDIVHINIRRVVLSYCWWSMVASLTWIKFLVYLKLVANPCYARELIYLWGWLK